MSVSTGIWVLEDTLSFGKYKGVMLDEVIVEHPTYVTWCLDEIDGFELDEEAMQLLEASLRSER